MDQIEAVIGRTVDSLFRPPLDYLLKQVEKPARYIGNEVNVVVKDPAETELRFAFAFPDMYEIGMSYMGLQIIYNLVNKMEKVCCERVFAPAPDMEALMRRENYPLFTLETKTPCREMDLLGFTLQYEMSFTNILNMLELSEISLRSDERSERDPLVIAGGPCAFNPEPLADFIDLFLIGDGEEALPEFLELIRVCRKQGLSREETLKRAAGLSGVYVPSFYEPVYDASGVVLEYKKKWYGAPDRVRKAIVSDLNHAEYPVNNIVPLIETVHDRAVVETFRGCTRGCRFCQAGMIYRPVRERSRENILRIAAEQLKRTGHDELALLSLSTSDYSDFEGLAMELTEYCRERNVSLSLPSLRLDSFSFQVLEEIQKYKKSGLTFAPEAGTQRLRDVINKGITEEDIYSAVEQAIELGWRHVKLYFMIGLPSETDADLDGIAEIAKNIINIHKRSGRGGRFNVTVSISNFVPKAHTPFQWFPQNSTEEFKRKHDYLTERLRIKGVTYNYHDDAVSTCEAVFARGDRRCGQLLLNAHRAGCRFDGWSEYFDRDKWNELLQNWEVDYRFYTERERSCDEVFPWDVIDSGVTKDFLLRENRKAEQAMTTADCRSGCSGCGVNQYTYCSQEGSHV
ncbi:TIGR03960 family B12-binding radical SAM protein [Hornefia butyriciproducens]|uniref:TIGR03960 family B12-binding radical SAM protein n=1 Tax=Hornefia butyriciproducens TaxID=2652293 RepID=UPI00389AD09F